jgi:hypothetical protein
MTPEEQQAMEQQALAGPLHEYRMGIETLIFAWLAESGCGLNQFDIKTRTVDKVIHTWIERKVGV